MADKYIYHDAGRLKEKEAVVSSSGATDAGKIPALDATGRLDETMMPTGIGADTATVSASEALSAGDFVNIYDDVGTPKCRKADAATNKPAHGFVLSAVTAGNDATIYFEGSNTQVTGMTAGRVYLSGSTPGAATNTPPTTSTYIVQCVGVAVSATHINVELGEPIQLA